MVGGASRRTPCRDRRSFTSIAVTERLEVKADLTNSRLMTGVVYPNGHIENGVCDSCDRFHKRRPDLLGC